MKKSELEHKLLKQEMMIKALTDKMNRLEKELEDHIKYYLAHTHTQAIGEWGGTGEVITLPFGTISCEGTKMFHQ